MLVMGFVVIGAASWFRLGVDRFPTVDLPTVSVRVELPGASTEETETQVAQRLEEQINTIQGINELRSISGTGVAIVIVTFNLNRQIDVAAQDVRDKVAIAVRNMPREILPPIVAKFDKEQRSAARLNGVPTVIMEVRRQSGENTVAVIEGVKGKLARLRDQVPPDVKLEVIRDQSRYIYAALHEINLHLVLGSILASLVVLAFMRSWRSTFIAAVAIPTSVVSAFGLMWALNFTLNSVTMLALVLMVGIVIDDAIVVLENVFRFVEEKKMRPFEGAREATADIGLAVMATTFSLVVIFVPVSFMSSISGRFLYQFGLTAAVSVMVSLLVSFTLTPMMCARLLRPEDTGGHGESHEAASRRGFYRYIDAVYTAWLAWSMRHRWVIVVVSVVVLASTMPIYRSVKQEYIPSDVDESEFEMLVFGPEGMSLAAMDEGMQALAKEARETKGVALTLASAGGGFLNRVNQGYMYVRTVPHTERTVSLHRIWEGIRHGDPLAAFRGNYSQREIIAALRQRYSKVFAGGYRRQIRKIEAVNIGGGTFDIDLALRGPDLEKPAEYGETL